MQLGCPVIMPSHLSVLLTGCVNAKSYLGLSFNSVRSKVTDEGDGWCCLFSPCSAAGGRICFVPVLHNGATVNHPENGFNGGPSALTAAPVAAPHSGPRRGHRLSVVRLEKT